MYMKRCNFVLICWFIINFHIPKCQSIILNSPFMKRYKLTFPITNLGEHCIYEPLEHGYETIVSVQAISSTNPVVSMEVKNPNGAIKFPQTWNTTFRLQFLTEHDGDYSICFMKSPTSDSQFRLSFYLFTYHREKLMDYTKEKQKGREVHASIANAYMKVSENLANAYSNFADSRLNVARDYLILKSNSHYINVWSMCQSVTILAIGAIQVFLIRRFFRHIHPFPCGRP